MKKTLYILISAAIMSAVGFTASAQEQKIDTIYISTLYTTHIVFATELTYADLSNTELVVGKIVEQNKNMLAIKARKVFAAQTASVTALETNGSIHTYILAYREHPSKLIIDTRVQEQGPAYSEERLSSNTSSTEGKKHSLFSREEKEKGPVRPSKSARGGNVSNLRKSDAPLLRDVINYNRNVYHITNSSQKVTAAVESVFSYSDMTYVVVSIDNQSGVSYETGDAIFIVESKKTGKQSVRVEKNLFTRNRFGTLTAAPGRVSRAAYALDKITLGKGQVLKIYIYENQGQRTLALTLSEKDVNLSKRPRE